MKRRYLTPPLLTNDSALPGETLTWTPKIVLFQSCCVPCLENDTALACYIFDIHQPILIFFVDNKVVLLNTVCIYCFSPSHLVFEIWYTAWLKTDNFQGPCSPGSAETLVGKNGITNHSLIVYSLSNISAKNN